jgi:hypothetical protein
MSSDTGIKKKVKPVEQMEHTATTNKWMVRLARLGYATKGVIYLIIGALAAELAIGHGGSVTDQYGALHTIYDQPFGKVLLAIVAIGLLAFALRCFIQALFDTEGKGRDAKGIIGRVGYALIGISYGVLAFGAYRLVAGVGDDGQSSTTSTQEWTALLLKQPFGVALVVLVGLVIIAVALYLFYKAYSAKFRFRLNLATVPAHVKKWVISFGRFGYASLGVVLSIIGIFLIVAAFQDNPHQAEGLDSALKTLAHQPFGLVLLSIVSLGLIAYGIFSFVEARYRRVGRG